MFVFLQGLSAQVFIEQARIFENNIPFDNPQAVAVSVDGYVYLVDSGNSCIHQMDNRGHFLRTFGGFGFDADQFDNPTDIWTKSLINLYVSDFNNRRVQRYDRKLNFISSLINDPANEPEFQFDEVQSCAINSNNDLFVLERGENKVVKFNRRGEAGRSFGYYESGEGELREPFQLDIQNGKFLLVSDPGNKAVIIYDFFGTFIRKLEWPEFKTPSGLCVLNDGKVLVADPTARKIFLIQNNLTEIIELPLKILNPLTRPVDIAIWQDQAKSQVYLIDGNQLVIGKLQY